jgi:Helix-turn-helix domain
VSAWQQKQRERQARFWELIRKGWTNTAACEAVGVERRQGYRWRKAAGGRIPEPVRPTSGRYLWLEERLAIADLHMEGKGVREIAAVLNRAPSTISRELERNASGGDSGGNAGGDSGGSSSRRRRGPQRRRYAPTCIGPPSSRCVFGVYGCARVCCLPSVRADSSHGRECQGSRSDRGATSRRGALDRPDRA